MHAHTEDGTLFLPVGWRDSPLVSHASEKPGFVSLQTLCPARAGSCCRSHSLHREHVHTLPIALTHSTHTHQCVRAYSLHREHVHTLRMLSHIAQTHTSFSPHAVYSLTQHTPASRRTPYALTHSTQRLPVCCALPAGESRGGWCAAVKPCVPARRDT